METIAQADVTETVVCERSNAFITDRTYPFRIDAAGVTTCDGCSRHVLVESIGLGDWLRIRPHRPRMAAVVA